MIENEKLLIISEQLIDVKKKRSKLTYHEVLEKSNISNIDVILPYLIKSGGPISSDLDKELLAVFLKILLDDNISSEKKDLLFKIKLSSRHVVSEPLEDITVKEPFEPIRCESMDKDVVMKLIHANLNIEQFNIVKNGLSQMASCNGYFDGLSNGQMEELISLGENDVDYKQLKKLLTAFRKFNNELNSRSNYFCRKDYNDDLYWKEKVNEICSCFNTLSLNIISIYEKLNIDKDKILELKHYYNKHLRRLINILIEKSDNYFNEVEINELKDMYLIGDN